MNEIINFIRTAADGSLDGVSDGLIIALGVTAAVILIVSIYALIVSIWLGISYAKYNKTENSIGKTGEEIARKVLDDHGLQHIKVSKTGSVMFGNSYSHFFKKVRLRRRTWKKTSVSALAMAVQKSALAVLDKEKDPDMRKRIIMTPFIFAGPLAFIPLVLIGLLLDVLLFDAQSVVFTVLCSSIGLVLFLLSFLMSVLVLKTEKKAQARALDIMQRENLANEEERQMCEKLFRLYNIEYINDIILSLLEIIYRVLSIVAKAQSNSSSESASD